MPNIGPVELVIILVIALLILGPGKLPDVGAALGKSIREFRKASSDVTDAVQIDTSPLPPTPAASADVATPSVAAAPPAPGAPVAASASAAAIAPVVAAAEADVADAAQH